MSNQSEGNRFVPQSRARMSFDEKEAMVIYIMRCPGVFLEARVILVAEHFSEPYEIIYAIVWRSLTDLYDQYGQMPLKTILEADINARLEAGLDAIPQEGVEELHKFVEYAFGVEPEVLSETWQNYGYDLLRRFLEERHVSDHVRAFMNSMGSDTPADMPAFVREYQDRMVRVQGVRAAAVEGVDSDNWNPEAVVKTAMDVGFIDGSMGGGSQIGEVYGLLGTQGSGKTMLASQMSGAIAKVIRDRDAVYVTYETPPNDIRLRLLSNIANIPIHRLSVFPWASSLSRTGHRESYEEAMFPNDSAGEFERLEAARHLLRNWRILNFTGPRSNPKAGSGWIEEIQADLEKTRSLHGRSPSMVFIDYALVCCRRYIRAKGWDEDRKLRHLVGSFADECRRLIAERFNCAVWVLSQLSGEANRRGPGARQHHSYAAEGTGFAENMWYAFCLGNQDTETGCSQLTVSKSRRTAAPPRPYILRMDGEFSRFVDASDRYCVDSHSRRIVEARQESMVDPAAFARASRDDSGRSNNTAAGAGMPHHRSSSNRRNGATR